MVILIIISVLLVGTTSFISALGYTSYVRNAIGIVLTPLQNGANYVFDSIDNLFTTKSEYEALEKENEELKLKLENQNSLIEDAEYAIKENQNLKEYLGIKSDNIDISLTDATITGREAGNYMTVFTLNRGTYHGIEPGMPVIDKYGVIGCIREVGLTWSKAVTIIETDVSVGVIAKRTGETGISNGTLSAKENGLFAVSYLPENTTISIGDGIYTSGDSAFYPDGLFLGNVVSIEKDVISRESIAYIKPVANLENPLDVMIITDFEKTYG